jgi:hypothetical protein
MAGMWGAFSATVIGALSNDSGPVIFALGFLGLLFATGYAWARPPDSGTYRRVLRPRDRGRERAPAG